MSTQQQPFLPPFLSTYLSKDYGYKKLNIVPEQLSEFIERCDCFTPINILGKTIQTLVEKFSFYMKFYYFCQKTFPQRVKKLSHDEISSQLCQTDINVMIAFFNTFAVPNVEDPQKAKIIFENLMKKIEEKNDKEQSIVLSFDKHKKIFFWICCNVKESSFFEKFVNLFFIDKSLTEAKQQQNQVLRDACFLQKNIIIIETLLKRMSKEVVNMQNDSGQTVLHDVCCESDKKEIVQCLIAKAGENGLLDIKTKEERTALHDACFWGLSDIVEVLLEAPSIQEILGQTDCLNKTPLHFACRERIVSVQGNCISVSDEVVLKMIDKMMKEDLQIQDKEHNTALHYICMAKRKKVIPTLITKMDSEALLYKNKEGKQAFDYLPYKMRKEFISK